jgi:oligosaccharide repeat unit polymerase
LNWSDAAWIAVFGLLFVGCLYLSLRLHGGVATPLFFFVGGYCISIGLYHLRLFRFPDVSVVTHLIVILSLAAFALGAMLASARKRRPRGAPDVRGLSIFFYGTAALSTLGWSLPLAIIVAKYGTAHLMTNLWILQFEFQMQFIGYLNLLGILVFPTFLIKNRHLGAGWFDRLLVLSALVGLLLAGIKSYLVYSMFCGVLVHSAASPRAVKIRNLAILGASVLLFFVGYNRVIDVLGVTEYPESRIPEAVSYLDRPYLYFAGALPAMEQVVGGGMAPRPVPGMVTLQPLWKIAGDLLGIVDPVPQYLPEVAIGPSDFNVYSFAGEVFWDWGAAGVAACSLLLGWALTALFRSACTTGFWMDSLLYAVFGYGAVIAFFLYYYRFNSFFLAGYVTAAGLTSCWAVSRHSRPTPDAAR